MSPPDWGTQVVAVVALFVSTFTVFYTRLQVRHAKAQADHAKAQVEHARQGLNFEVHDSATNFALRMDEVFLEYPLLRPYFYDNAPLPAADVDPELHHRVLAAAELVLDILESIWDRKSTFGEGFEESWREWIHDAFAGSAAVRRVYSENEVWYPVLKALRDSRACTAGDDHAFFTNPQATGAAPGQRSDGDGGGTQGSLDVGHQRRGGADPVGAEA